MARPKLENGYVRISNELLEALCKTKIPNEARRILDVIIRKTYGFNKKTDHISLSQFSQYTGISTANASRAIRALNQRNIIVKNTTEYITSYSIQKDYSKWITQTTVNTDSINTDNCLKSPQTTVNTDSIATVNTDRYNRHVLKTNKRQGDFEKSEKRKEYEKEEKKRKPYPDEGFTL